ncbi:hypothetical protein C0993_002266 [Termitomyces sp. T159_Od127]|nr:hypothetical protein C0993_002266 [Termitomyces sp. T159_Od127]
MTPEHLKRKILAQPLPDSPLKGKKTLPVNKRQGEFDIGTELEGYGLQGVNVTEEELRKLVAELGLDGDEAGDLAKELSGPQSKPISQSEVEIKAHGNTEESAQRSQASSIENSKPSHSKLEIPEGVEMTKASI